MTVAELIKKLQSMPSGTPVVWMERGGRGFRLTGIADVTTNATTGWIALISEETRLHMQRKGGR